MSAAEEAEVASAMPVDPAPAEPAIAETQPQKPPKRRSPKPQRRRRKSPKKALPILLISRAKRRQRITASSPSLNSCPWNFWSPCSRVLKGGLSAIHVPYAYGFAIILLTVIVKVAGHISFDEAAGQPKRHLLTTGWSVFVAVSVLGGCLCVCEELNRMVELMNNNVTSFNLTRKARVHMR
ncbi:hypothetical protein MRB53_021714 [Persea americana]|uniref:Uncharacterized protein n=1 Tax=Persea americana TaxID=3435 RepID=A0ACC2L4I8_PERAE|nr:hypothetical protein MRB53_021714 [Persea americana]